MDFTLWVHFLWYTFYGQFDFLDYLIKHLLGIGNCQVSPFRITVTWGDNYLQVSKYWFLITGLLWDLWFYCIMSIKPFSKKASHCLDQPI